jgi:hypothetical protein
MKVPIEDECYISCSRGKKNFDLTWIPQNVNFLANNNTKQNLTLQCQPQSSVKNFNSSRCQPQRPAEPAQQFIQTALLWAVLRK